jgi:hypothetical protein
MQDAAYLHMMFVKKKIFWLIFGFHEGWTYNLVFVKHHAVLTFSSSRNELGFPEYKSFFTLFDVMVLSTELI